MTSSTSPTKHTVVVLVLDKSGSMAGDREAVIVGFNEQIQTLKQHAGAAGETAVSLVTFSDPSSIETVFAHRTAAEAVELTAASYRPNGSTALFDAIDHGIDLAQTHPHYQEEGTAVLLLTFTDGQENASSRVTAKRLGARIRELEASGRWTVTLLGPDGVQQTAKHLAMRENNVMVMPMHTRAGKTEAFTSMGVSTASFMGRRGAGERGSMDFYGDEKRRRALRKAPPGTPAKP